MPNLFAIQEEVKATKLPIEKAVAEVSRKYLTQVYDISKGRNVISYYSGWLQNPELAPAYQFFINDEDKSNFMNLIHGLDHKAGLDLFLHTPGGDIATTESLIDSLRDYFGKDIRIFVGHLALSAATMIACTGKEIFMGRQSSLGPVDPQMLSGEAPAHSILREFDKARKDIIDNPKNRYLWQPILKKYPLTLLDQCEKAIEWSKEIVKESLEHSMFADVEGIEYRVSHIVEWLTDPEILKVHNRHLSLKTCQDNGLVAFDIYEIDSRYGGVGAELKEAIYGVHWANICAFEALPFTKIIEGYGKRYYEDNKCSVKRVARSPKSNL